MEDKNYKEHLEHIHTFIFDVDGVLTDGTVTIMTNGDMLRRMNIKDGYALKTAVDAGFNVCIISGGSNLGVQKRLEGLGIKDNMLFVCDGTAGLKLFDKTDPLNIDMKKSFKNIQATDVIPLENTLIMIGGKTLYQYKYINEGVEQISSFSLN